MQVLCAMDPHMYGSQDSWMGNCGDASFMPKIVQRRAKRSIPDNDKDDKYWEKRKRNNMAAKRSRECKRQAESDVRNKVSFLEEENALLRKEISLMKAKFGIPPDQSFLSQDDRSQCMHDMRNPRHIQDTGTKSESEDGSDNSMMSPTGSRYPMAGITKSISPYNRINTDMRRHQEPGRVKAEMNGYEVYAAWNQLPTENGYVNPQMYQNGEGKYPIMSQEISDKHALYANYERYMTEENSTINRSNFQYYPYPTPPIYSGNIPTEIPADLTLSRKVDVHTPQDCSIDFTKKLDTPQHISPLKLPVKAEYFDSQKTIGMNIAGQLSDSSTNGGHHRSDMSNSSQDEEYYTNTVNSDQELKSKLQQLSSQYNEMKK